MSKVKMNLEIEESIKDKLQTEAKDKDMSLSALVRVILKSHIEEK